VEIKNLGLVSTPSFASDGVQNRCREFDSLIARMHKEKDPIQQMEEMVKEVHDSAKKYTQPVLRRYPLVFAFLIVFSISAISDGFRLFADDISLFREHPTILIVIGVLSLLLTGKLYKSLEKMK